MAPKTVETDSEKSSHGQQSNRWTRKKKLIISGIVIGVIIVLGIGLGVGLGLGLNQGGGSDEGSDNGSNSGGNGGNGGSTSSPTGTTYTGTVPTVTPVANAKNVWQPAVGTTWDYLLGETVTSTMTNNTAVLGLDLYNTDPDVISGLQANGAKIICYFSAGSWENWRPDAGNFTASDVGKTLEGWPNEKWLNVSSNTVRNLMLARLDLAKEKGCDGVDPDNVDGYNNKNGLGLTQADSVDYMTWLAGAAQSRNMSIGLKNAGDMIPSVIEYMQWSVNEQCLQFQECSTFAPFIQASKPVFHVEYPKGDNTNNNDAVSAQTFTNICNSTTEAGFSTIIKNIILDGWIETC